MQREDVERLATELDRQDEYAPLGHMGWESAAALRALLAERDAARAENERLTKERDEARILASDRLTVISIAAKERDKAEAERDEATIKAECWETTARKMEDDRDEARDEHRFTLGLLDRTMTERDDARSMLADAERDMRQRAADTAREAWRDGYDATPHILALPLKHADREGGGMTTTIIYTCPICRNTGIARSVHYIMGSGQNDLYTITACSCPAGKRLVEEINEKVKKT